MSPGSERFEFQKWPVYRQAIVLGKKGQALSSALGELGNRRLEDQLRRASQSVALNIAEGTGRHSTKEKMNFFRIARGSVFECVAILDLGFEMGHVPEETKLEFEEMLEGLGKMLSGLIRYLDNYTSKRRG